MKKVFLLATVALLATSVTFAGNMHHKKKCCHKSCCHKGEKAAPATK